jgi:hypothetical protein
VAHIIADMAPGVNGHERDVSQRAFDRASA